MLPLFFLLALVRSQIFILWAKTTYIYFLGGYSFSVYSVAVGSLVVSSIIASFLPWDDEDEQEESVF